MNKYTKNILHIQAKQTIITKNENS